MTRLLQVLATACLGFLAAGFAVDSSDSLLWLANGSDMYQYIRLALLTVLALQLFTVPPRYMAFRVFSGLVAAGTGAWVIAQTYATTMPILDTVSMAAAACVIGVTTLELQLKSSGETSNSEFQYRDKVFSRRATAS